MRRKYQRVIAVGFSVTACLKFSIVIAGSADVHECQVVGTESSSCEGMQASSTPVPVLTYTGTSTGRREERKFKRGCVYLKTLSSLHLIDLHPESCIELVVHEARTLSGTLGTMHHDESF